MTAPATNAVTTLVQTFLPRSLYPKAKALVAGVLALCAVAGAVVPAISGAPTWVGPVIGAVGVVATQLGVYFAGNQDAHDPEHDGTTERPAAD